MSTNQTDEKVKEYMLRAQNRGQTMTKLSNSQKIQKLLDAGCYVEMKSVGGKKDLIIFHIPQYHERFLTATGTSFYLEEIDKIALTITPIPRKPSVYPVGTRVKILPNIGGVWDNFPKATQKRILDGEIFIIENYEGSYEMAYSVGLCQIVPFYALVPHFEEEEEKMVEFDGIHHYLTANKVTGKFSIPISVVREALARAERGAEDVFKKEKEGGKNEKT